MNQKTIQLLRPYARKLRKVKIAFYRLFQGCFHLMGLNIVRLKDFYSPLPVLSRLWDTTPRWSRPSRMTGIRYDLEGMKKDLQRLLAQYGAEYQALPPYDENKRKGFGPGFTAVDALVEYLMIRDLKPARYIEVGSGLSTYYASLAAAANAKEGRPVQFTCIEPYPYEKLFTIPQIEIIQKEVQDVDLPVFERLGPGDVLFIDSTHIVKVDSDVSYLLLEILPNLKAGVSIHVHDIPFPYNIPYPPEQWVFGMPWPMYWTEAMLLQALLCNNDAFEITMSTPLIRYYDEGFLRQQIPGYQCVAEEPKTFCSLWMRKMK